MPFVGLPLPISFYFPHPDEIGELRELAGTIHPLYYRNGERIWIPQTYRILKSLGYTQVLLTDTLPPEGTVIFHPDAIYNLHSELSLKHRCNLLLVAARADRGDCSFADIEIVQNQAMVDSARKAYIPHWLQPGLIPRDPSRGTEIRNVAFTGLPGSLSSAFRSQRWLDYLKSRGLTWVGQDQGPQSPRYRWHDYSDVDLVVALRPPDSRLNMEKPASKLFNAWTAEVPAVLGQEIAYREIRQSEQDYIEANDMEAVCAAIDRLKATPDLYTAMVENGRRRAPEFSAAATAERWAQVLGDEVPRRLRLPEVKSRRAVPARIRLYYWLAPVLVEDKLQLLRSTFSTLGRAAADRIGHGPGP